MLEIDEPDILDGSRAFLESQAAFRDVIDPDAPRYVLECSWYDTVMSPYEGAFAMVQTGTELEGLIGDIIRVSYQSRVIFLLVVGSAQLDTEFAIMRSAFFQIADLSREKIRVSVQSVLDE